MALRSARLALVALVVGAARWHPGLGLGIALVYAIAGLVLAGWSFRLMVLGSVFSTDFLLGRRRVPSPRGVPAFARAVLPGVRRRTYGRVARVDGRVVFAWRPWLVLRRRSVELPPGLAVAEGLLSPVLEGDRGSAAFTLARFPPRFRGQAREIASQLGGLPVRPPAVVRSLRGALDWLRGPAPA